MTAWLSKLTKPFERPLVSYPAFKIIFNQSNIWTDFMREFLVSSQCKLTVSLTKPVAMCGVGACLTVCISLHS